MDGCLILEETCIAKPNILRDNKEVTVIETILQEAEQKNRNKRIYKFSSLYDGINSPMVKEKLQKKSFVGEAGRVAIYTRNSISKLS